MGTSNTKQDQFFRGVVVFQGVVLRNPPKISRRVAGCAHRLVGLCSCALHFSPLNTFQPVLRTHLSPGIRGFRCICVCARCTFPFEHLSTDLPTHPTHPSHLFRIQPSTARRRRRSAAMGKLRALRSRRQRRRNMTRLLKAGSVLVVTAGAQLDTTTDAARRLRTTGAFRPGCGVFDFIP